MLDHQTSEHEQLDLDGPFHAVSDDNRPRHDWHAVTVSGFNLTSPTREVLHDVGMQHETLVRCHAGAHPPYPTELLRLERLNGTPLSRDTVSQFWHRPPYVMPFRLVRYAAGSSTPDVVDLAAIGTQGEPGEYLTRVEAIFARLVKDAIIGTSRGQADLSYDVHLNGRQRWFRPPYIDYLIAKWRVRLFAEWWSIGVATTPVTEMIQQGATGPVPWLSPDRGEAYWADPFPWPGTDQVLCEEMPMDGGVGRIVALSSESDGTWRRSSIVLDDNEHHSYPCAMTDGEDTLFLPEAVGRGATTLYRLRQGEEPEPICAVAPERRLADPTLFRSGGLYWIACTDLDIGMHDNMCLLHADQPEGPWRPHRCTPVKIDICGARPAGPVFRIGEQLFRPGQDCARTYGAAVLIHRIETVTPDTYRESVVARLAPDPDGPFPDGLHTLAVDNERVWLDGKRLVLDLAQLPRKAMRKIGRLAGRERAGP
jgi:hypothetical protein